MTEELNDDIRTFNYGPSSQKPPISISQNHIWRSSMTSASVALHESNLALHADTFVLRRMCIHHVYKVTRHRKPDEWWITSACAKAGRQLAAASEGPAVVSQPCQPSSPARCHCLSIAFTPWPHLPEVANSLLEKSPSADGATYFGWPIQALCPCHTSLTLVFWLKHFKTGPFSFGWDTK